MSKRNGTTRIKLSDFKERKEAEGAIEIEAASGEVYRVPPPELWPDEVSDLARAGNLVAVGKAIMGEEQYEAFRRDGGSATILNAILAEEHGLDVGESQPSPRS